MAFDRIRSLVAYPQGWRRRLLRATLAASCLIGTSIVPTIAGAQEAVAARYGPRPPSPLLPVALPQLGDSTPLPGTPQDAAPADGQNHTWEGAAIGAGILGVLMAATFGGICAVSDTETGCSRYYVIGGITGALVGGVLGAMIGGNMWSAGDTPAGQPAELPSAVR